MPAKRDLAAPCGLDCFNCPIYQDNLTDAQAEWIHRNQGIPKEAIACRGCRLEDGRHYHLPAEGCATLNCVKAEGVALCCDCADFPCALLGPLADGAAFYPHNMKVYSLCRIQRFGLDRWLEEAADIRRRYYGNGFVVGKGQGE